MTSFSFDHGKMALEFCDDSFVDLVWNRLNVVYRQAIFHPSLNDDLSVYGRARIFDAIVDYYSKLNSEERDSFDSNAREIIKRYQSGNWSESVREMIPKHVERMLEFFKTGKFVSEVVDQALPPDFKDINDGEFEVPITP